MGRNAIQIHWAVRSVGLRTPPEFLNDAMAVGEKG